MLGFAALDRFCCGSWISHRFVDKPSTTSIRFQTGVGFVFQFFSFFLLRSTDYRPHSATEPNTWGGGCYLWETKWIYCTRLYLLKYEVYILRSIYILVSTCFARQKYRSFARTKARKATLPSAVLHNKNPCSGGCVGCDGGGASSH